jgi:GT2 family glycosyltransferase
MADPVSESAAPQVSVIMGTLDEEDYIESSLDALLSQRDFDAGQMEILIADGGSTDDTRAILDRYQEAHHQVRWFENPARISPAAWNICLDHARGDVIVLMGGHTVVGEDFVSASLRVLDEVPDAACVGGPVKTAADGYMQNAIALAGASPFGAGNATHRYADKPQYLDTVSFGAYRKEVFEKVGRFREDLSRNADWEFNYRMGLQGLRIFFSPEIQSTYHPRSSLGGLWKQQFQTSLDKVKVILEYPGSFRWRHSIPTLFVLAMIGGLLLGPVFKPAQYLWKLTARGYVVLSLVFSATAAQQGGWRYLPILPVVFLTIHVGYGLGFIAGWLRHLISRTESAS